MTNFRGDLREAIIDWHQKWQIAEECRPENRNSLLEHQVKAWQQLESLINRCVDEKEALCGVCQYNLNNHPPGPDEPNIFTYKTALELACKSIDLHREYSTELSSWAITKPEYWIEQAEKLKTTHVDSE